MEHHSISSIWRFLVCFKICSVKKLITICINNLFLYQVYLYICFCKILVLLSFSGLFISEKTCSIISRLSLLNKQNKDRYNFSDPVRHYRYIQNVLYVVLAIIVFKNTGTLIFQRVISSRRNYLLRFDIRTVLFYFSNVV